MLPALDSLDEALENDDVLAVFNRSSEVLLCRSSHQFLENGAGFFCCFSSTKRGDDMRGACWLWLDFSLVEVD